MYCPECGTLIEEDAVFCPECGTRVADDVSGGVSSSEVVSATGQPFIQAFMLTNMAALANKLKVTQAAVHVVLDAFIAARKTQGVEYTLIDGNSYDTGYGSRSLRKGATWMEWADMLREVYRASMGGRMPAARYLFIVGGDDIVPMPVIRHYLADDVDSTDTTIDTDVPYAYPYGGQAALRELVTGEIFDKEAQYMVGRLPLPTDARFAYLTNYLERAAALPYVKVRHAYSQCDPHWRKVTRRNVAELRSRNMLRAEASNVKDETCYLGIYLTPEVDNKNVSRYFAPETQLAFFNLHGSAALGSPGFMGQSVEDSSDWRTAITPSNIQSLVRPNIIITEACYGARFIGFDTGHSMLQAAFAAQTLIYLGSSRIAYGSVDSSFSSDEDITGSLADVLTSDFVMALMQGYTAGDALCKARYALLDKHETGPYEATTLAEFNLYGDPTLQMAIAARGKAATVADPMPQPQRQAPPRRSIVTKATCQIKAEKLEGSLSDSVLQMVRGAVDNQICQIQESIAKELYDYWGIRPRHFLGATRLHFTTGSKALALHYEVDDDEALAKATHEGLLTRISVIASPQGGDNRIKAVYATR